MQKLLFLASFILLIQLSNAQYCIPTTDDGTVNGDYIASISLGTLTNTSGASGFPFYSDYTSLTAPDLAIDGSYALSITAGTVVNDRYAAWIDWNNDQDFDDEQELLGEVLCTSEAQVLSIAFQVPVGISIGNKRMRVRCAYQGLNMDPCGNYIWSETEDYLVNIIPELTGFCLPIYAGGSLQGDYIKSVVLLNMSNVTGPSVSPFYDYFSSANVPDLTPGINYVVNVENGLNDYNRFAVWIDWNNDADFLDANENLGEFGSSNGFDIIQFPFTVPLGASSGIHRMRVRSAFNTTGINPCLAYSFGETEDYDVRVVSALPVSCNPTHSNSNGHFISDVSMGYTFNPSGELPSPHYLYYSNLLPAILYAGNSNTLSVTSGYSNTSNYAAWIDFNRDGDFDDLGEKLGEYSATSFIQHHIGFIVPVNASPGAARMRVRCTSAAFPIQPCGNYADGETEDYNVTIVSNSGSTCFPISTYGNLDGDFIKSVIGGSINNINSGLIGTVSYHDYPNQVLMTSPNANVDFQVVSGNRVSIDQGTFYAIWVDWNNNNQFELNEKIGEQEADAGSPNETLHFTLNVPINQASGMYRIRVRSAFGLGLNGSNMNPCSLYSFGETQDYRLMVVANSNYCTTLHSNECASSVYLDAVRMYQSSLLNDPSGCNGLTGNAYTLWPASGTTTTQVIRNYTYSFAAKTNASARIAVWTDWDQNGQFTASEYVEISAASIPNQLAINYLTVPIDALVGITRMRVRCVPVALTMSAADACSQFNAGETEDYWISVTNQLGLPPQANFTFNVAGSMVDFFDFSANLPDFWFWQFQDSNPSSSISQDVQSVTMLSPGCHDVTLTAYNDYGYNTITKPCAISIPQSEGCTELFISEYVDHSMGDAIELFNPKSTSINLAEYSIAMYQNGAMVPTASQTLSGSLQGHGVFVISSPLTTMGSISDASDLVSPITQFDGNDAIALMHNGVIIDLIGQIGIEPLTGWDFGSNYTPNGSTFIRKQTSDRPETNWSVSALQWDLFFDFFHPHQLGIHSSVCGNSEEDLPVANFSVSIPGICAGSCISFTDVSTGNPIAWDWSFPGASISSSTIQNPSNICYPTPGVYPVQLIVINPSGSDTLLIDTAVTVYTLPETPNIVLNGNQLEAISGTSPVFYQWYFNGSPLAGSNNALHNPTVTGDYTVLITDTNGCQSSSSAFNYTVLGISDLTTDFSLYPNPTNDILQIKSTSNQLAHIELLTIQGQILQRTVLPATSASVMSLENLTSGVYFLRIQSAGWVINKRVIKN